MAKFAAFFTLIMAATSAWAQDKPSPEQIARAVHICETEFMVSCTPGGDPRKERCFTVPECYKIARRFYSDLLEKFKPQEEQDREFIEDTAKNLK